MFSAGISLVAIVVAMYLISPKMATITLLMAPVLLTIGFYLSERIRLVLRESKRRLARMNSYVAENIGGMQLVQLFDRVRRNRQTFNEMSLEFKAEQIKSVYLYAALWPMVNFFNGTSVALALYFGGILTRDNVLSTGSMIAFILHVRDFIQPLRMILEKYQLFQNSLSGAERVFTLFAEKPERNELLPQATNGGLSDQAIPLRMVQPTRIEIQNLKFRYADDLPFVFDDFSLSIDPGQSVAIVGRTGSGKSTLVSLLQRFYPIQSGSIKIGGIDISEMPATELRRRLGVVAQDGFIFKGTIADNIALFDSTISQSAIEEAAKQSSCWKITDRKPNGLLAHVEERGMNLSFGERQLIAFARALAFQPQVLILDEATSNIDSESERLIQEATAQIIKGRTSIIIAHRLSTIRACDKIVVLEKGHIVEMGPHEELMANRRTYFAMSQMSDRH